MRRFVLVLLCVLCAGVVFGGIQQSQVIVSPLKYDPAPAEAGSSTDVYVKVQNEGLSTEDFTMRVVPAYPFSVAETEQEVKSLGRIPAGEEAVVMFRIDVDVAARAETKNLTFLYKYQKQQNWVKLEYPIQVETSGGFVTIDEYVVEPRKIRPGEQARISLTLQNNGRIGVKNVDVMISPDLEKNKFSIVGSGTTKRISNMWPEEKKVVVFDVVADTTAAAKVYEIPVRLSFSDVRNRAGLLDGTLALFVGAVPEVRALVDKTALTKETMQGVVALKFINSGVVDLKYVNVVLEPSSDYVLLSPSNEAYVGNLDSDDFETMDFFIRAEVAQPVLKVSAQFKDSYNQDYQVKYDIPLRVHSEKDLGKKKSGMVKVVMAIFVVCLGVWFWQRRKRKK